MTKVFGLLFFVVAVIGMFSCTSKLYPVQYYEQHNATIHEIETLYKKITASRSLSVAFYDLSFSDISLEFKTDSVRYIYDFAYHESRINDSLARFGFDTAMVQKMIGDMRRIGCSWINNLDYYVDGKKQYLVFMSVPVKQFSLFPVLQKNKYYLFNFYAQPQYYDEQGRLLDKKKLQRLRKINSEVFRRINEKVCYTISGKFR